MTVAVDTTPFRPEPLPQHSSSSYWEKDCVPTAIALCVNGSTVDALRPTPWNIRQSAQVLEYRGMSYGEGVVGAVTWTTKHGRRVTPVARYSVTRTDFKSFVDGGKRCVVSISCQVTHNTLRETNDYVGNHSVSAHDYRWVATASDCRCELKGKVAAATDHGEFLVEDPGTTTAGWLWWSAGLLYKAAEARTGGDGIDCVVFPDTENVSWKMVKVGKIRAAPSGTATAIKSIPVGSTLVGGVTRNGTSWERDSDGLAAYGYIHVRYDSTHYGWVRGEAGAQA